MADRVLEAGQETVTRLLAENVVDRIWQRDPTVWTADAAVAPAIGNRLGWLTCPTDSRSHLEHVRTVVASLRGESRRFAWLLGMGGSSLCAEVLHQVYGSSPGFLDVQVLDTTDPHTIHAARQRVDPMQTAFVVASKSGTTVEVSALERYFANELSRGAGRRTSGKAFIAVTDPGTPLVALAAQRGYRDTFVNAPDIGGRFSALSLFGLVPAGMLGVDLDELLSAAEAMAAGCRQQNHTNPGLELGAIIGAAALEGRDKLTLVLPRSLSSLGLWIEQLVAESTGKSGKGVLPIVDEPPGDPSVYGSDRIFVHVSTDRDSPATPTADWADALTEAGHPVIRLTTRAHSLGAEFFRWEFATAVVGAVLGVNPFDEPNVTEAKDRTRALLETFGRDGRLPEAAPSASERGLSIYGAEGQESASPAAVLAELFRSLRPRDYVAFLSYLPSSEIDADSLAQARVQIRAQTGAATTFGIGPRYLHSTGQYHKGGPDTGVFVLITHADEIDDAVPGMPYTFAVLKRAQALGDFQALRDRGRRVVRVHLDKTVPDAAAAIRNLVAEALRT